MADVIFRYPDGRTGQTTEEGFAAYHEEFGAELTAYVDSQGRSYPANDEGRNAAEAAAPNELTAYSKQVEALQARESARLAKDSGADDATDAANLADAATEAARAAAEAEATALADAEAARVAAEKEAADAVAPPKGKGK